MTTTAPEVAPSEARNPDLAGIDHLIGVAEIAEKYSVSKSNVASWANRRNKNGYPLPVLKLASGRLYDARQVQAWYDATYGQEQ